jgi:hypothetical protein
MRVGHRIALVLDPDFGGDLTLLGEIDHAWVVRSSHNPGPGGQSDVDITTFSPGDDTADDVAHLLFAIDEHHGTASGFPPLASIEVWGQEATPLLTEAAAELGLDAVEETPRGFVAKRP